MDKPNNVVQFPLKPASAGDESPANGTLLNAIAFAWIVLLIGGAAWTFEVIATIPKRDCNFSVRRPCTQTASPVDTLNGFSH